LGGGVAEDGLHDVGEDIGFVDFQIIHVMAGSVGLRAASDGIFWRRA
jgi:hypothetical protein